MVGNSLIEPPGMPEGIAARSYVRVRLIVQSSIDYIAGKCACASMVSI